ncbi:uncharacterized protein LOC131050170 [Cryptomeria japonica]|uniref:uncharacterized protein LOC131050170 n=1 Tax=Cryptomeria japonica TaxID=3369 RepID=UPI0025AD5487|nr:uncharacterized protein LOC131050170 [Cryptomeria japonica]
MPKKAASLSESLFELAREKYEQVDLGNAGTSKMLMPDSSVIVAHRPTRYTVSVWTCSKIALAAFAVGVFVGFSLCKRLKRSMRRWSR